MDFPPIGVNSYFATNNATDCSVSIASLNKESTVYSGKIWRGGSLENLANRSSFAQTKAIQHSTYTIDNLLADLLIRQKLSFAKIFR